jgi:hypothetical protein
MATRACVCSVTREVRVFLIGTPNQADIRRAGIGRIGSKRTSWKW